jgi:Domain of unknown function (DUF4838)
MKKIYSLSAVVMMLILMIGTAHADEIILAQGGQTPYRIVISEQADLSTQMVAMDFAGILREMTGALFPVVMDSFPMGDHEIILGGDNTRLEALGRAGMAEGFSQGEYEIRTQDGYIIIAGGPPRGTINGVYGFLQDHLGCRWLTPGCQYVPRRSTVKLGAITDRQRPAFRWRSTDSPMQWDANWTVRNRLNESKAAAGGPRPAAILQLHGDPRTGTMANTWNPHAFQDLPASLYNKHPQWYALIGGERVLADSPVRQAYCMTNDGFARWVARWTIGKLQRNPRMRFVSITHADNSDTCQCQACRSSNERIGVSGTSIAFANKVAKEVVKVFPDATIITFAYSSTFAPSPIKAHPNVRVIWAPIGADYAHGLDEGEVNREMDFMGQLARWQENSDQLGVWYYQYNSNIPLPRPSLSATRQSLRVLRDRGVDQVFIEMYFNPSLKKAGGFDGDKAVPAYAAVPDYYTRQNDYGSMVFAYGMEHVNAYINGRLLWDPDYDVRAGVEEFCRIYYGDAGDEMAEIVMAVQSPASYDPTRGRFKDRPGFHMDLGAPPMKVSVLEELNPLFDTAESRVKHEPMFLRRIEIARMGIDLALLIYAPDENPLKREAYDRFFGLAQEIGLESPISIPGLGRVTIAELKQRLSVPRAAGN